MIFVLNWYSVDFHVVTENGPPLAHARLETHPYGVPPFELRAIWIAEMRSLEELLDLIGDQRAALNLCLSGFWSGATLDQPGQRLFGIALYDDINRPIDPADRPREIRRSDDI